MMATDSCAGPRRDDRDKDREGRKVLERKGSGHGWPFIPWSVMSCRPHRSDFGDGVVVGLGRAALVGNENFRPRAKTLYRA